MRWRKTAGWVAGGLVIVGIAAMVGGYWFLNTDTFRQYALHKIEQETTQATGAQAQIGALRLNLSSLTAHLDNVVIRGTERADDPPLLRIDELTVGLKIQSVIGRKVSLSELFIQHPIVHLQVDRRGQSNLPQAPPSESSGHTSVFDLAIGHAAIANGEIYYNDKKTPLDANLYDLQADVTFNSLLTAYKGSVSYGRGEFTYAQYAPLAHAARLKFTANPSRFSLESAVVSIASSTFSASADLTNFNNPAIDGKYDIRLHAQDFAALSPNLKPAGDIHLVGSLHYQDDGDRPFLRNLSVNGQMESAEVSAQSADGKIEARSVRSDYKLANAELEADKIEAAVLGGRIIGKANVRNLDSSPLSRVSATIQNVSLRAIQQAVRQQKLHQVAITGGLSGSVDAAWSGNFNSVRAHSDLTVRADAASVATNSGSIPVDATIHAAFESPYGGSNGTLIVRQSNIRTPAITLTADGEVSRRSSLRIHAQVDDLHQLLQAASGFVAIPSNVPPTFGSATMDATVQGSLQRPQVSGELKAANLRVQASNWRSAAFSFTASPSQVAISNGSLVSANQGQASFDAHIGLRNWSYDASNPIRANLSVQRLSITELQNLAHLQYPISGDLSAHISVSGSQIDPSGSGSAEISNARAYGEPIQTLALKFQAANASVASNLNVASVAGSATASLTYTPKTRAYKVKLDAQAITLQKLHSLQSRGLKGNLSASATGEGSLDDPQFSANLQIPDLVVQQKSINGFKASVQVANQIANVTLDSQISDASVRGHAQVHLTGDYQTDASIDTGAIPLAGLLATFSSSAPEGLQGQTELHATLKGPLKDKTQIEAHVTIPSLNASYQQLQISATGPIHADFANSIVTLQPAEISGTGTSLHIQGSMPVVGSGTASMTAQGTIDTHILQLFDTDVQSSGTIELDLHASQSGNAPAIQGQIRLQDIALSTTAVPLGVEKLNGTLNVENDRVQIAGMTAQMGSGEVSVGGTIIYRPDLQFTLALQGNSIRLRYPTGLRTLLDANLALNGNQNASSLNGRVLVDSLSFTPDFDLSTFGDQFSSNVATPAQPGFADTIRLNVSVQSKSSLSANSSQVSVEGALALNVSGTAADPVITGRTELTSGELFYRGNRYQLQRGVITFADPNQTNPNLNVSVSTTVEQYNLTLDMRGPLDRLTTSYKSDPPLASADIIHLIAFGNTTSEAAANSSSQSTDSLLATSALGAGVTSGAQKLAGLSSLQIDPLIGGSNPNPSARIALQQRVTKNFLFTFSTDVSQPGQEVVQGDYQINKRWSVSVTRDQLGGITVAGRLHTHF